MIRVAIDCRMTDWSGVGRYTVGLARALAESGGCDLVQVVGPDSPLPVPGAPSVVATGSPFSPAGAAAFAFAVRRVRPDITHCPHFPTPIPAPRRLVVTMHDFSPLLVPGVMPSALRRVAYRWWIARAVSVALRIITLSAYTASDVVRYYPDAGAKLRVVPAAADDFSAGPVGALPAVAAQGPYLLSMGNTKAHKDLPTLLRAFARIAPAHPDLRVLLVGPEVPGFIAGVLGDDPAAARVGFTGAVDDAALAALYADASAFVFPSRYEGFGLPPLEAMALGAPVVIAEATSLPEVAGAAALSFPCGDDAALAAALAGLLADPAERERLVEAGRAHAATFTWARTAAETLRVYREALGQG